MSWLRKLEPLLFVCAVALSRFVFRSHELYDLDSVNFALSIGHFDPRVHQPHPPGYFLYVCLARLLNSIVHDANLALVIMSIAASCGVIVAIYRLALDWFGLSEARFAGLLFLCSPLGWFHGTVALTYSVEAFFSALLGYLCWRVKRGKAQLIVPAAVTLGISAGVRPSSLLFLGPLYVYSQHNYESQRKLAGIVALVLTLSVWFIPMISASGGLDAYFGALFSLWHLVPSKSTVFNSSPANSVARACVLLFIGLLNFGAASLVLVSALRRKSAADRDKKYFTIVWVAPALCFFTFIFLQFVNSGYLLLLTPPASIWLGFWAAECYRQCSWPRPFKLAAMGICVGINIFVFLQSPFYCSYRSIRGFETQLEEIRTALPQLGTANDTLVVGFDSHFLGYRHAGYYLPEYLTVEYPEVDLKEGMRVFAMRNRGTELLEELPLHSYRRFVLFPLPSGDPSYAAYLAKVKRVLPNRELRTIRIGDKDFITGPVALLPLLFPHTARAQELDVYPPLHAGPPDVYSREHQDSETGLSESPIAP